MGEAACEAFKHTIGAAVSSLLHVHYVICFYSIAHGVSLCVVCLITSTCSRLAPVSGGSLNTVLEHLIYCPLDRISSVCVTASAKCYLFFHIFPLQLSLHSSASLHSVSSCKYLIEVKITETWKLNDKQCWCQSSCPLIFHWTIAPLVFVHFI